MALSTIAAISTIAGTAANIANSAANSGNTGRANAISAASLTDARNNELYQKLVSAMTNQRSIAGTSDSYGSTTSYDPYTNTWKSQLGELPLAADTASMQAGIRDNTTNKRLIDLANEQEAKRAAQAGPGADQAQRNFDNFRPMSTDTLVGLLSKQGTNAANETFNPIIQNIVSSFARQQTNPGSALATVGKTQAGNLRDTLLDAQIKGMENVGSINASNRSDLSNAATTAAGLARPNFQASPTTKSDNNDTLLGLLSKQQQTASTAPAYSAYGTNTASTNATSAANTAATNAGKTSTNPYLSAIDQLSGLGKDTKTLKTLGSLFGGDSSSASDTAINSMQEYFKNQASQGNTF